MNFFRILAAFLIFSVAISSCVKDPVKPKEELNTQEMSIDMHEFNSMAFIVFDRDKNAFEALNDSTIKDRSGQVRFIVRPQVPGVEGKWIFSSPADPNLNDYPAIQALLERPDVKLAQMPLSEYEGAKPANQTELQRLFDGADVVNEGYHSDPLSPDTVLLVQAPNGEVQAVKITICAEGDNWKVCITIQW